MKKILLFVAFLVCGGHRVQAQNMIEDFEGTRLITYGYTSGNLSQPVANPYSGPLNSSSKVGQYARSAVQYDVIVCNTNGIIASIGDYVSGAKKFTLKLYTTAPVGTNVELTIQNAAIAVGAYPVGRHSNYRALTTVTNAWEVLTFNFTTQPDPSTSGGQLDQIVISFNNNSTAVATYTFDELAGPAIGAGGAAITRDYLWSDFMGTRRAQYWGGDGQFSITANPSRTIVNNADSVGRYIRSSVQYDVAKFKWDKQLNNLSDYKSNTRKFSLNVYSPAPGTTIQFTLQDSVKAHGLYPAGRFAEFTGVTTTTNQWEHITLNFSNAPDVTVSEVNVNELAVLFNSGATTPVTVYVDSVWGPQMSAPIQVISNEFLWSNFSTMHRLKYWRSDGALSVAANPSRIGNLHDSVGKYVRSTVQYDVLQMKWDAPLADLASYKANRKKFSIRVYSQVPGNTVQFTLQDSVAVHASYPVGRYAEFTGLTTKVNAWETIVLNYTQTPDPTVTDAKVSEIAILFNSNTTSPITFYIDSLYGPAFNPVAVSKQLKGPEIALYPQPAGNQITVSVPNAASISEIQVSDLSGKVVMSNKFTTLLNGSSHSMVIDTQNLGTGVYFCRVTTEYGFSTHKFVIEK